MHIAEKGIAWPAQIVEYFRVPEEVKQQYEDQWFIQCKDTPEDSWGKVQAEVIEEA